MESGCVYGSGDGFGNPSIQKSQELEFFLASWIARDGIQCDKNSTYFLDFKLNEEIK